MNIYVVYGFFIAGFLSFVFLLLILGVFGKIIKMQMKYWLLAKKGYVKVEHVGEDRIRRTYFLKPTEDKFDIDGGFYAFQKDALIRDTDMFPKFNKDLLNSKKDADLTAEEKEYKGLLNSIGKFKFSQDSVYLNWGIPTITYYGTDVNPHQFSDRKKIYDGKIFKAIYMRLLLLKEWKFIRMAFIIIMLAVIIGGIFQGVTLATAVKVQKQNQNLIVMLNQSIERYNDLVNKTLLPAYTQRTDLQAENGTVVKV